MAAETETPKVLEEEKVLLEEEKKAEAGEEVKKEAEAVKEKEVPPPPPRVHKVDFEKDKVYLYQFSRTPVLPSLSPYCLKVETFLRLTEIKYENVDHKTKFRSAKGQLPFVELNGEEIADSTLIISKLSQHFGVDQDAQLTQDQKNSSHALTSMIENHLNWVHVYWRSKNPDAMIKGYKMSLQHTLGSRMPNPILAYVFKWTYSRKGAKKVKAHGLGVHSAEEIFEFGKKDLAVLEETLGNKQYFFGDKPSTLDVVAFAHLSQITNVDKVVEYNLRDWFVENCPNLIGLLNRIKERCFPDWDEIGTTLGLNTHIPVPVVEEKKEPEKEANNEKVPDEKASEPEKKEPAAEEVKKE